MRSRGGCSLPDLQRAKPRLQERESVGRRCRAPGCLQLFEPIRSMLRGGSDPNSDPPHRAGSNLLLTSLPHFSREQSPAPRRDIAHQAPGLVGVVHRPRADAVAWANDGAFSQKEAKVCGAALVHRSTPGENMGRTDFGGISGLFAPNDAFRSLSVPICHSGKRKRLAGTPL